MKCPKKALKLVYFCVFLGNFGGFCLCMNLCIVLDDQTLFVLSHRHFTATCQHCCHQSTPKWSNELIKNLFLLYKTIDLCKTLFFIPGHGCRWRRGRGKQKVGRNIFVRYSVIFVAEMFPAKYVRPIIFEIYIRNTSVQIFSRPFKAFSVRAQLQTQSQQSQHDSDA